MLSLIFLLGKVGVTMVMGWGGIQGVIVVMSFRNQELEAAETAGFGSRLHYLQSCDPGGRGCFSLLCPSACTYNGKPGSTYLFSSHRGGT